MVLEQRSVCCTAFVSSAGRAAEARSPLLSFPRAAAAPVRGKAHTAQRTANFHDMHCLMLSSPSRAAQWLSLRARLGDYRFLNRVANAKALTQHDGVLAAHANRQRPSPDGLQSILHLEPEHRAQPREIEPHVSTLLPDLRIDASMMKGRVRGGMGVRRETLDRGRGWPYAPCTWPGKVDREPRQCGAHRWPSGEKTVMARS